MTIIMTLNRCPSISWFLNGHYFVVYDDISQIFTKTIFHFETNCKQDKKNCEISLKQPPIRLRGIN